VNIEVRIPVGLWMVVTICHAVKRMNVVRQATNIQDNGLLRLAAHVNHLSRYVCKIPVDMFEFDWV
jgi:hypothetical protein